MTYCLGIVTKYGLVMASDSRTNAGYDQINVTRKMHTFVQPGERVLHHVLGGGLVSHQHQREPDKLSMVLAEDQGGVERRW